MKKYFNLVVFASLASTMAFAQQGEERDFGDLVPEKHFKITHSKTSFRDDADIKNYVIVSSPKKDEYTYKVADVKTPRGKIFGKKKDFKLEVQREEGKVTRFSSVSFTDNSAEGGSSVQAVQSTSVLPSGYVNSQTNCYEEYKTNIFGTKKDKSGYKCVTVSAAICEYMQKNELDETLIEKINSCSDLLSKLSDHQEHLYGLSKDDHKKDMAALTKLNGKLSNSRNFYEVGSKTLKDISEIVGGYGAALSQCDYLRAQNYLEPRPAGEGAGPSGDNAGAAGAGTSAQGKTE